VNRFNPEKKLCERFFEKNSNLIIYLVFSAVTMSRGINRFLSVGVACCHDNGCLVFLVWNL